jgi:hypothetical protein
MVGVQVSLQDGVGQQWRCKQTGGPWRQEVVDVQLAVLDFALGHLGEVCGRPRCVCSVVFSLSSTSVTVTLEVVDDQ